MTDAIRIVLVEPAEPGNIGAAARAMKTTGFSDLRIVRPRCDLNAEPIRWLAYHSHDIIAAARIVDSVEEAVADCQIVAGFSARLQVHERQRHVSLKQFVREWKRERRTHRRAAALVFGSERYGLPVTEVQKCTHVVTIPLAVEHPALNLAQAVMIACYEFHSLVNAALPRRRRSPLATERAIRYLLESVQTAITARRSLDDHHRRILLTALERTLKRLRLDKHDLNVLHKVVDVISHERAGKILSSAAARSRHA